MNKFIRQHLIRIAIGVISFLILLSASLSYYNNRVMTQALVLKEQSNFALREVERVYQNIQLMDISGRGYALVRQPDYLFYTVKMARDRNMNIFHNLDSIFVVQGFEKPQRYDDVKAGLTTYTDMFAQMVDHLANNQDSLYMDLLKKDLGRYFWEVFTPFSADVTAYEVKINQDAQAQYERASLRNRIVQLLLVFVGIPTMIFVGYRLAKDERERRALLLNVAENNNTYLFNDGKPVESEAKSILDGLMVELQHAASFVNEISARNYEAKWEGLDESNVDLNEHTLAGRLMYMRDEMRRVKQEDNKRIWSTEGLSELSQLIRKYQNEPEELTFRALTFLVKYTKSQQGSMFVLERDEADELYLKLSACYAFDRKKFINKRVNIGEGLVGQVYMEGRTTLLKTVPAGYISITSGLGDASPSCVLLVPMKHNDTVQVILELASFHLFAPNEIEFLERAGEFIASAIANVQNNEKNKQMMVQMQQQAEQMKAQEEEMRQNLEELEATQEDMRRRVL